MSNENKTTSQDGIDLIKSFESCKLKAYPDPKTGGAPWTVGWGATGSDIDSSTVWSQDQADSRLLEDVAKRETIVKNAVEVELTQGQFNATVSIVFNVGSGNSTRDGIIRLKNGNPSTLLKDINNSNFDGAEIEWLKWISPGSSVTAGLLRRRKAELVLFQS
jgi:lysozyme